MMYLSRSTSETCEQRVISSEDGCLSFVLQRGDDAVYVERVQPLAGIGKLSHIMRFGDMASFDRAHETDAMRFKYPLAFVRLRQAVEEGLGS